MRRFEKKEIAFTYNLKEMITLNLRQRLARPALYIMCLINSINSITVRSQYFYNMENTGFRYRKSNGIHGLKKPLNIE